MVTTPAAGPHPLAVRQRVLTRAITSLVAWLAPFFFVFPGPVELAAITRLLLFALIVVAPLPLALVEATEQDARVLRLAQRVYLPAAVVAVGALLLPVGFISAALVVPWLGFSLLVALTGLVRLRGRLRAPAEDPPSSAPRRGTPEASHTPAEDPLSSAPRSGISVASRAWVEELSIDAGLLYLPVGGIWLLLSRLGANPLGFGDTIVLLTAVHFHFAGYAAPVIAGLAGRRLRALAPAALPVYRPAALGIIAGMALVAVGITITAVVGALLPEVVAVAVLAISLMSLAALVLRYILPGAEQPGTRLLFLVSGLAPFVAMVVALAYAGGRLTGAWTITIPQMVEWHGYLNAIGFVFCSLLAWLLSPSTLPPEAVYQDLPVPPPDETLPSRPEPD